MARLKDKVTIAQ